MKKHLCILSILTAVLMASVIPGHAEYYRGHHGGGGWGPGWGPVLGLGLGLGLLELSRPHYYPYQYTGYYSSQPIIIQQRIPDVYLQPAPQYAPPQQPQEPPYWYYCKESQAYFPYVKECPQGWMKVVPTPPAPQTAPNPATNK